GNRFVSWNARPMPPFARAEGDRPVISSPPLNMRPSVGFNWPETRLNHVVLPAPFGPTITVSSPGWNAQVTPLTAAWPPKRIVRVSVRSEGVIAKSWCQGQRPLHRLRRSPSPVNGGGSSVADVRDLGSSPAKRGRGTMLSMVEGAL